MRDRKKKLQRRGAQRAAALKVEERARADDVVEGATADEHMFGGDGMFSEDGSEGQAAVRARPIHED